MPTYRIPAAISYTGLGGPGVNVWHARGEELVELDPVLNVLETFYTSLASLYNASTRITIGQDIINISDDPPTYAGQPVRTIQGTGGSDKLPPSDSVCVTWRTSVATRSGRGRTFLGPFSDALLDSDGTPETSRLELIAGAAEDLVVSNNGLVGTALGVFSTVDGVIRDIQGYSVRDQFAVLRSRRD